MPKIRTIGDEFTLSLARNLHFSFLPSHFPPLPSFNGHNEFTLSVAKKNWPLFTGSAEALPILCVRYFRRERERERERDTEKDGSDVTIVALKLAMSLKWRRVRTFCFSLHTSRLSLLKWSLLWRWNSQWVHTSVSQKTGQDCPSWSGISQMARAARRVIENWRQMSKSCPVLHCSSHRKTESN